MARSIAGLPSRTALAYAVLFTAALILYPALWPSAPVSVPDSPGYLRAAQDLSDLHIDRLQDRAPGYPLLVVLTGGLTQPRLLFYASLILHCWSVWVLAVVLGRAGVKERALVLFGLVLLLPPYVEAAGYVRSENLAEALLVTAFASVLIGCVRRSWMWLLAGGVVIGATALTRPAYQLQAFAIAAALIVANGCLPIVRRRWRDPILASLILVIGTAVLVGGYASFNYRRFGYFGLTPKFGLTLSTKTARVVERLPDEHAAIRNILVKARDAELLADPAHNGQMYIWGVASDLTNRNLVEQAKLSGYMLRLNVLLIREAPLTYLQEVVSAFGSYWFPASSNLSNLDSRRLQAVWVGTHFLLFGAFGLSLLLVLGAGTYVVAAGLLRSPAGASDRLTLLQLQALVYGLAGTIVFYTAAVSCLIEVGDPRYRMPTDSLIVFMLVLGIQLWRGLIDLPRRSPFAAATTYPETIS